MTRNASSVVGGWGREVEVGGEVVESVGTLERGA